MEEVHNPVGTSIKRCGFGTVRIGPAEGTVPVRELWARLIRGLDTEVDWLTASGDCEIEEDDRSVSVTCRQNQMRLKIVASPGHDELIVKPHRPFSLEVDDGVEIADDFRLVIIPQTRITGTCTIRAPVKRIRCDAALEFPRATGPRLGLAHSADVEFTGGSWTLDSARNSARVPVNVVAASGDAQTKLTCNLPIESLRSTGDHAFSLRWTEGTAIMIVAGSPTFETPLHRVSLSGTGEVVAKGDIADSTVDLSGSLTAGGDVTGTAIDIKGSLTVSGNTVLDTHELTCGTAHISGSLDSRAKVKANSLTVEAGIAGTSEIETHDLICNGPLSAGKVTATGTTRIHGNAQCDEMRWRRRHRTPRRNGDAQAPRVVHLEWRLPNAHATSCRRRGLRVPAIARSVG